MEHELSGWISPASPSYAALVSAGWPRNYLRTTYLTAELETSAVNRRARNTARLGSSLVDQTDASRPATRRAGSRRSVLDYDSPLSDYGCVLLADLAIHDCVLHVDETPQGGARRDDFLGK